VDNMKTRIALTEFIDELIYQVVLANRHLSDAAEMPDSEYKTLRFVAKNNRVNMRQVADFLGVSMPRATKIADNLVEQKYVKRENGKDRRCVELCLDTSGKKAIEEAFKTHQDLSEAILTPLSSEERETMRLLITKCQSQFKN
jgi:DNA-binding MarR family transcriptional regulator